MKLDEYAEKEIQRTLEYSFVLSKLLSEIRTAQTAFQLGYHQALQDLKHFIRLWPARISDIAPISEYGLYQRCEVEDFVSKLMDKLVDVQTAKGLKERK